MLLEHGQPLIFGAESDKALAYEPASGSFRVTTDLDEAAVHDETSLSFAHALAHIDGPGLPTPLGVIYCVPRVDYTSEMDAHTPYRSIDRDDLKELVYAGSWEA